MKICVIVAFVAAIAAVHAAELSEEQKAKEKQYITECREQIKLTDEEIAKLKTGEYPDASEDVKCFANCVLEKAGIVKDGALQEDVVIGKFSSTVGAEKAKKVLDLCRGATVANKCETAFNLHSCLRKNAGVAE